MATVPSSEEAAQYILDIFVRLGCRAGYVLSTRNFLAAFVKLPWHTSDFAPGISYAAEQGWVEVLNKDSFKLTELGFSKASADE